MHPRPPGTLLVALALALAACHADPVPVALPGSPAPAAPEATPTQAAAPPLPLGPRDVGRDVLLLDIHLDAAGRGVVVGGAGPDSANGRVVLVTRDGGATWTDAVAPAGKRLYGVAMDAGGGGVTAGLGGTLFRTADHGGTWVAVATAGSPWYAGVACPAPGHFLVIGNGADGPVLRTSDDGGRTWTDRSMALGARDASEAPRAIAFRTAAEGWIVGDGGFAARTADGGRTWTRVPTGTDAWLRGVHFLDADHGVIAGWQAVLVTDDGGATWRRTDVPGEKVNVPRRLTVDRILATTMGGRVLGSRDGGRTWTDAVTPVTPDHLVAVRPAPGGGVVIVGAGGRVLHIDD